MAVTPPDQVPSFPASAGAPLGIPLPYGQVTDYSTVQIRTKTTDEINTTFLPLSSSYISLLDNVVENSTGSYSVTGYRQITHPQQQFDVNFTGVAKTSNVSSSFPAYLTSSVAFYFESGNQVDVNLAAVCLKQPVPTSPNSDGKLALGIADTFSLGYLDNAETGPGIVGIVDLNTVRLTRDPTSGLFEPFIFGDATATTNPTFYNPNINTAPFGTEQTITLILDDLVYWIIVCYLGRPEDIANSIVDANAINGFPVDVRGLSIFAPSTFDIIKETTPFSTSVNSRTAVTTPIEMTLDQMLIEPAFTKPFYNTPCDVLINNAEEGRPNPFIQDIDYATSTTKPINYNALASESAARSTIPESHYTQLSSVNPRYNGAKLITEKFNFGDTISSQYSGGVHALYYKVPDGKFDAFSRFQDYIPKGTLDLRDTVFNAGLFVSPNPQVNAQGMKGEQIPNPCFGMWDPDGKTGTIPKLLGVVGKPVFASADFTTNAYPRGYYVLDRATSNASVDVASPNFNGNIRYCQNFDGDIGEAQKNGLCILFNVSASDGTVCNTGWNSIYATSNLSNFPNLSQTKSPPFTQTFDMLADYDDTTTAFQIIKDGFQPVISILELQYIINPDKTIQQLQNTDSDLALVKSLLTSPGNQNEPFSFGSAQSQMSSSNLAGFVGFDLTYNLDREVLSSLSMMSDLRGVFGDPTAPKYLNIMDLSTYVNTNTGFEENLTDFSPFGVKGTCIPFKMYNTIGLALFNTGSSPPIQNTKAFGRNNNTAGSGTILSDPGIIPGGRMGGLADVNSFVPVLAGNTGSSGVGGFIYPNNIEFTDSKDLPSQFIEILFDNNIITPEALYKNKT